MISYDEAYARIIGQVSPLPTERHAIQNSLGLVLAEDVVAPAPVPGFRNSAMDGYAVRFADWQALRETASAEFRIVDFVRAGLTPTQPLGSGEAAQIATGAMLPDDADTVVPVEDCTVTHGHVVINGEVTLGQCIRQAGQDVAAGAIGVKSGQRIGAGAIGMMAALGRATVKTYRRPRVAIVTTGDELVSPGSALKPGQIYNSNGYSLAAQVEEAGGTVIKTLFAKDDRDSLRAAFDACGECDVLITTGGVSVGEFDFVKEVFAERGTVDFWQVAIRPGKPLAFGHWGEILFFGLPGNPVSSMVTFELFVRPTLRKMMGDSQHNRPSVIATLAEPVRHSPGRRSFLRATVTRDGRDLVASLSGGQDSGMLHAVVDANALIIVPETASDIAAGSEVSVLLLD